MDYFTWVPRKQSDEAFWEGSGQILPLVEVSKRGAQAHASLFTNTVAESAPFDIKQITGNYT